MLESVRESLNTALGGVKQYPALAACEFAVYTLIYSLVLVVLGLLFDWWSLSADDVRIVAGAAVLGLVALIFAYDATDKNPLDQSAADYFRSRAVAVTAPLYLLFGAGVLVVQKALYVGAVIGVALFLFYVFKTLFS